MRLARFALVRLLHATDLLILRKKNRLFFSLTLAWLRPCLPPAPNPWLLLLFRVFQIALAWYFIMATRGATMMILEIHTPTFLLITYVHYSWKEFKSQGLREPIGRIAQTSWPRQTRFKHIFCLSRKDFTYRKCLMVLLLVASMSTLFDNRCVSLPPYCILHQCLCSPVLER